MAENFSLFTSLRYDDNLAEVPDSDLDHAGWNFRNASPFYMLDYHRDRMLRAATHWQWEPAIKALAGDEGLRSIASLATQHMNSSAPKPARLRIVVDRNGGISFETNPTPERPLVNLFPKRLPAPGAIAAANDPEQTPPYALVLDTSNIARSEFTHFKTTKRAMYDAARTRAGIAATDNKEVLIVNEDDGSIMEGSTTTPYFWRGGRWVTPPVSNKFSWEDGSGGQDGTTRRWALENGIAVEEMVSADSVVSGEGCWISNGVRGFLFAKVEISNSNE